MTDPKRKVIGLAASVMICLLLSWNAAVADEATDAAIRYALGAFNPTANPEQRLREVEYIRDKILAPEQSAELQQLYKQNFASEEAKRAALQQKMAEFAQITFISFKDGTTYWESKRRGQYFSSHYLTGLRGNYKGESLTFLLDEMKANLQSVEWSHNDSGTAVIVRRDGKRFALENASFYATSNRGNWWCMYHYTNPITEKAESKVAFGPNYSDVKRIVFGLQMPKMNPKTGEVFPGDYIYDPYDRATLIPVEWTGSTHRGR